MDRFPRTAGEFLEHRRNVVLRCVCGAAVGVKPENLIQRLGREFDLYAGFSELRATFPCERCGQLQETMCVAAWGLTGEIARHSPV
jgi:hypothetical protein